MTNVLNNNTFSLENRLLEFYDLEKVNVWGKTQLAYEKYDERKKGEVPIKEITEINDQLEEKDLINPELYEYTAIRLAAERNYRRFGLRGNDTTRFGIYTGIVFTILPAITIPYEILYYNSPPFSEGTAAAVGVASMILITQTIPSIIELIKKRMYQTPRKLKKEKNLIPEISNFEKLITLSRELGSKT